MEKILLKILDEVDGDIREVIMEHRNLPHGERYGIELCTDWALRWQELRDSKRVVVPENTNHT